MGKDARVFVACAGLFLSGYLSFELFNAQANNISRFYLLVNRSTNCLISDLSLDVDVCFAMTTTCIGGTNERTDTVNMSLKNKEVIYFFIGVILK